MNIISLILMLFGFVLFTLAGLVVPQPTRINFIGLGLACWLLAEVVKSSGALVVH